MDTLKIDGIIRTILSAFGAYLLGSNLFGQEVNEVWWEELTGVVLGIVSVIWSIRVKTVDIEKVQGVLRQLITFAGGILVALGKLQANMLVLILALIPTIAPAIYAYFSRMKTQHLDTGKIKIAQLKK